MSVAKHKGEKQARFIFSDPSPPSLPPEFKKVPSSKITALNIESDKVTFYSYIGNSFVAVGSRQYLTDAFLLGAIIQDDPELFSCVSRTIFERAAIVTNVLYDRVVLLNQEYLTHRCALLTDTVYIEGPTGPLRILLDRFQDIVSTRRDPTPGDQTTIRDAMASLSHQNDQAQRQSCAVMY